MSELRIGDRVCVYGWVQMHNQPYKPRSGGKATVVWVNGQWTHVKFDCASNGAVGEDPNHYDVHPKQCRKLIKRERRRVWLRFTSDDLITDYSHTQKDGLIPFIEVKKK